MLDIGCGPGDRNCALMILKCSALVQKIGDISCLVCSGSCLLGERARAAICVSPQLGPLLTECAAASPLGGHMFRYQVRDRLKQNWPGGQWYGHQLMFQFIGNEFWSDVRHGVPRVLDG
jgi:hypothetical protein